MFNELHAEQDGEEDSAESKVAIKNPKVIKMTDVGTHGPRRCEV